MITIDDIVEASKIDGSRQTTYDDGFDRKGGFIAGSKWVKKQVGLDKKVTLVFKNKEGNKKEIETTFIELLNKTIDDYYEDLESTCGCTSSGCNNENQNFCDCGPMFENYIIHDIKL